MAYDHRTCPPRSPMVFRLFHKLSVIYICLSMFFLQKVWHTFLMNFHHYGAFSLFSSRRPFIPKSQVDFFLWVFNTFIFACVQILYQPTSYPWNHQKIIVFLNFSRTSLVSRVPICPKPIGFCNFSQTSLVLSRCGEKLKFELPDNVETWRCDERSSDR